MRGGATKYGILLRMQVDYKEWFCRGRVIVCDRPIVMGILNVTPDSFYAESCVGNIEESVARACKMVREGAQILDVGGESTRPGATPVSIEEELRRVIPVIEAIHHALPECLLSIDSRHLEVVRAAAEAGAVIYNDVDAGLLSEAKAQFLASSGMGYILVHRGEEPVEAMWSRTVDFLLQHGVRAEQLALDAGFGFEKSHATSLALLAQTNTLTKGRFPYVVAASRKRFIGALTGQAEAKDRLGGSVGAALWAIDQGAEVVRVHDVGVTVDAIKVFEAAKQMRGGQHV